MMIEPKELMCFNLVTDDERNIVQITRINSGTVHKEDEEENMILFDILGPDGWRHDWECDTKSMWPIPLSTQVLEACGFDGLSNVWTNGFFSIAFFSDGYAHWDGMHKTGIGYRNLHQLQNLYFLLTGHPLEIDLQKLKNALK